MTKPEAETLVPRLTQIWKGIPESQHPRLLSDSQTTSTLFQAFLSRDAHLRVYLSSRQKGVIFHLNYELRDLEVGFLYASGHAGLLESVSLLFPPHISSAQPRDGECTDAFAQFTLYWLPYFRRGCWLSGADIAATAHEKAEWMQGCTKEEIEAWGLKM